MPCKLAPIDDERDVPRAVGGRVPQRAGADVVRLACTISSAIAFVALNSEHNSFESNTWSCACEAAVARAESPRHALSALRSSFAACCLPAPVPCCAAGIPSAAAGVGRAPPACSCG